MNDSRRTAQLLGLDPDDPEIRRNIEALSAPTQEPPQAENSIVLWALALAFGAAGAVAWKAPVIAFFWPLGMGVASLTLALVAKPLGRPPSWAIIAVLLGFVAVGLGLAGMVALDDARNGLL